MLVLILVLDTMARRFFFELRRILFLDNSSTSKRVFSSTVDQLDSNPFYKKYQAKISSLQKSSPEVFEARLSESKKSNTSSKSVHAERLFSQVGIPKPNLTQSFTAQKKLDSVMKLDLIKDKSAETINEIWHDYHKSQDKICAVIPAATYAEIKERAKTFPIFVFPVPKSQGYEFILAVWENDSCHFTSLINYQAHREDAPECLTITHYPDLMEEKGIVLMHGTFDKLTMNATEAQCLANQLKLYYTSSEDNSKYRLLKVFTHEPNKFKHMDLITELESTSIGVV